jgi:hypothetical protein
MRKYIATDSRGQTINGHKLTPGKFVENKADKKDLVSRIGECCCDSALLAALVSPFASDQSKLFMINCWNVAVDPSSAQSYTVIKDVTPVPSVSLEQKIDFAADFISRIYKNDQFRRWAGMWLGNEDRTGLSAKEMHKIIQKEIQAASDLEALTAWGETGGNDENIIHDMDEVAQRALHVVRAVECYASAAPDTKQAAREISKALIGLGTYSQSIDFVSLAEELVGNAIVDHASLEAWSVATK